MTSTTIYQPFTYCITFILTGQRYYGSRYSENQVAHPDQLWTTYFTSSKIIADLIEEHGVDSFTFEIRKLFKTRAETLSWENKFLTRINAAKNPEWLNGHNGGKNFHSTLESVQKCKDTKKRNGTEANNLTIKQKAKETRKINGTEASNPRIKQKSKETKLKNGTTKSNTLESIQKCKDTKKRNGTESSNPRIKQKCKETRKINGTEASNPRIKQKSKETRKINGTEHNMKNPETVQKVKDTKKERGIEPPMKNPESVQKRKDTMERNGNINPSKIPFLSLIYSKKTYSKGSISRNFPEFKEYY